jgi:hypothetical protein
MGPPSPDPGSVQSPPRAPWRQWRRQVAAWLRSDRVATPLAMAVGSRLAVLGLLAVLVGLLPLPLENKPRFLDAFRTWDGNYYVTIANEGYAPGMGRGEGQAAFFPLYPLAGRALSCVTGDTTWALLLIANVAFGFCLYFLYGLARDTYDDGTATRAVLYLSVFPAAFIFSCAYSEALFLALVVGSFYFARQGRWTPALALAALATLTRLVGLCVFLPLAWEMLRRHGWQWRRLAWLLVIPAVFGLYPLYLWHAFGDPLAFVHVQVGWHREFTGPWGTVAADIRYLLANDPRAYRSALVLFELNLTLLFFLLILVGLKFLPVSFSLYAVPLFLIVTATSVTSGEGIPAPSATRYLMTLFPVFVLLGRAGRNVYLHYFLLFASLMLLGPFALFFFSTWWVC